MKFSVHSLPRAEQDIRRILEFIQERSPTGAQSWQGALDSALIKLKVNPLMGSIAPENNLTEMELRQILFKTRFGNTYRAVYTVSDKQVFILRVRGSGQAPLQPDEISIR